MARVFLSHSSSDSREAVALKRWLVDAEPGLANEIFLDLDRNTGIRPGVRWKEALKQANERCEAVICLITESWDASHECRAEFRTAEPMNKPIYAVASNRSPVATSPPSGNAATCSATGRRLGSNSARTSHPSSS